MYPVFVLYTYIPKQENGQFDFCSYLLLILSSHKVYPFIICFVHHDPNSGLQFTGYNIEQDIFLTVFTKQKSAKKKFSKIRQFERTKYLNSTFSVALDFVY